MMFLVYYIVKYYQISRELYLLIKKFLITIDGIKSTIV